nr:MAG TPA: hypothetical protein [Caudoviricetes sp.]
MPKRYLFQNPNCLIFASSVISFSTILRLTSIMHKGIRRPEKQSAPQGNP